MAVVVVRGQSVEWPMEFFEDEAETIPKDCTGAVISITDNSTGAVWTTQWTDQANGKAELNCTPVETRKMKTGRFGKFNVFLIAADGAVLPFGTVELLVE
jgi:hypothetical protein